MVSEATKLTEYLFSFYNTCVFLYTNLSNGWGTYDSVMKILPTFILYNLCDIVLGNHFHEDIFMFIHHMFALLFNFVYTYDSLKATQNLI